ncbi:hypothetical protein Tco_1238882 [Tanacetum coccineum]
MASSGSSDITNSSKGSQGWRSEGILYFMRLSGVQSHHQNSGEAGVSKDMSGEKTNAPVVTKLNLIFITAEVTFIKLKQPTKELRITSSTRVNVFQRDKGYVRPTWTGGPERARNRGGQREARRNMGVYTPYPRKDTFTPLTKTLKEILAMESFCDYHRDKGHNTNNYYQLKKQIEEAVALGKLAHIVKDILRNNQVNGNPGRNGVKVINMIRQEGNRNRSFEERRIREQVILRTKSNSRIGPTSDPMSLEKTWGRENAKEAFTISHEHRDQYVMMGTTLTTNCKQLLANVLRENREVFTWTGLERTTVLRFVMECQLKIYPLAKPVVHKRRPMASEGRLALKEKVFHWLKEGLIRKVQYPEWIANTIPIKLASGTWKVQVDYSSLNKVCSKDMYPLPKEGEELASLMGYPYKCFLRLPKEYSQIRMAKGDEEKTRFHMEEGKIDVMSKRKSEKGLVAESFEWHEESMSFDDEGVTKVKAFMAIDEDEPAVGKGDARSGQWVEITMKKVQRLLSIRSDEERKHVLDYTYVDLHYVEDQMKNLLSKFNSLNQELSLLLFSKATESPSETVLELISDSESECDNQEPLSPLPKLLGAEPSDTSNNVISFDNLTLTPTVFKEIKKVLDKRSTVKVIKKKAQPVTSSVPGHSLTRKTELIQLVLTFMEEVKVLKAIKIPSDTSPSVS